MLSPEVRQVVEESKPTEDVAFLVSIESDETLARAAGISDRGVRNNFLDDAFYEMKQPFVTSLAKYEDDGMRIIDELDGTPQLIVAAPAGIWRRMIHDDIDMLSDPRLELFVNEADWHLEV